MNELDANATVAAEHLFVTRMWCEESPDASGQWRGSVTHVNSKKKLYFANLADLIAFIMLRLDVAKTRSKEKEPL